MVHSYCKSLRSTIFIVVKENLIGAGGLLFNCKSKSSDNFSKQYFSLKMPKPVTHTIALKNHRQKLKEKGQKYSPGTVNLQVLGSGANGAPRSLYVFTDQSR